MKHFLRKLHIGSSSGSTGSSSGSGGSAPSNNATEPSNDNQQLPQPPQPNPRSTPHSLLSATATRFDHQAAGNDFNYLEEQFQMQLALAISASADQTNSAPVIDSETALINAAKRISLNHAVDSLSLRYWTYNVIDYTDKITDGFYDVYGVTSSSVMQGKMPTLLDLQEIPVSDNSDYEVILVNRLLDSGLQLLEKKANDVAVECCGMNSSCLIQKLADIVVERMGGPVGDANETLAMWKSRSYELRKLLNSVILPLGRLDVGLSRHRALLFKVLADRINLPCMLVKGSYYTGTDDGAVNFIKIDNGSEFIIDLMGAPGTLIPAEVSTSHISTSALTGFSEASKSSSLVLDNAAPVMDDTTKVSNSRPEAEIIDGEMKRTLRLEKDFESLPAPISKQQGESSLSASTKLSVDDVSEYVISAAKNPEFAQKLHAFLLESGASPSLDSFTDINQQDEKSVLPSDGEQFVSEVQSDNEQKHFDEILMEQGELATNDGSLQSNATAGGCMLVDNVNIERNKGNASDDDVSNDNSPKMVAKVLQREDSMSIDICNSLNEDVNPKTGIEILWEDLQIGERIGIGSYGEVYRADLHGTDVAVKKFLDQDFSGNALAEFKCEIEIMLRLRHPNIVLFMGAVTRPPHFSIVTEFLLKGSLFGLLHGPQPLLGLKRRMRMAFDVAKGMNYLHRSNPVIVHRDLKTPNLLVDKNWIVKVCDFGLSRFMHHTFLSSKASCGTAEWMAPEVLRNEPANEKCDVYSFGVILWELVTLRVPWRGLNSMQVVGAVGYQNRHLEIPEDVHPAVGAKLTAFIFSARISS
ncbi:hypothetical protein ACFE04_012317 [Oxalis oulophora]